jgi:hypothetical protein
MAKYGFLEENGFRLNKIHIHFCAVSSVLPWSYRQCFPVHHSLSSSLPPLLLTLSLSLAHTHCLSDACDWMCLRTETFLLLLSLMFETV